MDTISRSAANSPVHAARPSERVRPVPHSAKDRLERQGEEQGHTRKNRDTAQARPSDGGEGGHESGSGPAFPATTLSPPPPVRPPPPPAITADSLEDGVEAIRRLMVAREPVVDLQR